MTASFRHQVQSRGKVFRQAKNKQNKKKNKKKKTPPHSQKTFFLLTFPCWRKKQTNKPTTLNPNSFHRMPSLLSQLNSWSYLSQCVLAICFRPRKNKGCMINCILKHRHGVWLPRLSETRHSLLELKYIFTALGKD